MNAAYHLITVSWQVDMATDFTINDKVFVPTSRIPGMEGIPPHSTKHASQKSESEK